MKPGSIVTTVCATLLAIGMACYIGAREPQRHWPKPTPPPDPSPIYQESKEPVPSEEEIAREAAERPARLEGEIEAGIRGQDFFRRETVLVFLLPELLQVEPRRVVDLAARLEPGDARRLLHVEMSRVWVSQDPEAAVTWIRTLREPDRRVAALAAVREVAPVDLQRALLLARALDLGRPQELEKMVRELLPRQRVAEHSR